MKKVYTKRRDNTRINNAAVKIADLPGEVWKNVKGYEGLYLVSNLQRIKKLSYLSAHGRFKKEKLIKVSTKKKYPAIALYQNGLKKYRLFHRIVCEAFHENLKNKPEVNHKTGWKNGHTSDNLEWATKSENVKHAFKNGFIVSNFKKKKICFPS